MEGNPYESPQTLSDAVVEQASKNSPMGRLLRLTYAYVVHHGSFLAGMFAALLVKWDMWVKVFPPDKPHMWVMNFFCVPVFDFFCLFEPFVIGELVPPTYVPLRWMRCVGVMTLMVAGLTYAFLPRRVILWYVGVVTFLIAMSLVFVLND